MTIPKDLISVLFGNFSRTVGKKNGAPSNKIHLKKMNLIIMHSYVDLNLFIRWKALGLNKSKHFLYIRINISENSEIVLN